MSKYSQVNLPIELLEYSPFRIFLTPLDTPNEISNRFRLKGQLTYNRIGIPSFKWLCIGFRGQVTQYSNDDLEDFILKVPNMTEMSWSTRLGWIRAMHEYSVLFNLYSDEVNNNYILLDYIHGNYNYLVDINHKVSDPIDTLAEAVIKFNELTMQ